MEKLEAGDLDKITGGNQETTRFLDNFKNLTKSKQFKVVGILAALAGGATLASALLKNSPKKTNDEVKKPEENHDVKPASYIEGINAIKHRDRRRRRIKKLKGDGVLGASPLGQYSETIIDEDVDE